MRNLNSSVYIRVSFSVADEMKLDDVMELRLDMRYDDGFIAYLNGNRVAQANAPIISPDWNSNSTRNQPLTVLQASFNPLTSLHTSIYS